MNKSATRWRYGKKWDGKMGWVFVHCRPVRARPVWSDRFAGMMKELKRTMTAVPKLRVSKHKGQRSKHQLSKARARG
jgi:hypothetical protein